MAVLHIVFMILKVIGILLLILLGILLLGVLALLFCPVRYQARGYRDKEQYGGKAGVSWLFHLIGLTVWYDSKEEKSDYEIRIFGIPVRKFFKALKQRKRKKTGEKRGKKILLPQTPSSNEVIRTEEKKALEPSEAETEEGSPEVGPERQNTEKRATARKKEPAFLKKIREILRFPGKIMKALKNFRLTVKDICDKIKKIKKFLENEKFKRGMNLILQEGKKLLIHVLPQKTEGYIKFGTEDPCLTGEILGAASIFYPLYGENFSIEPCFDQTVLEGTVFLKGRMYGVMLLISAVKIFRSRDVRYIIRHFRQ